MIDNGLNPHVYNAYVQNQVSDLLSYFNDDIIYDTVIGAINNQKILLDDPVCGVNLVEAIEQNYKKTMSIVTDSTARDDLYEKRNRIYDLIIKCICNEYNLSLLEGYNFLDDLYTLAYYMYDLFVSEFRTRLVTFYANYIYKEKNNIYANHLTQLKKEKNISMMYGKKIYKNNKLAIINTNIEYVINCMLGYDISFEEILNLVYNDKLIVNMFLNNIASDDIFKNQYSSLLRSNLKYRLIFNISNLVHLYSISEE